MRKKNCNIIDKYQERFNRYLEFLHDMGCDGFFTKKEIDKNIENLKYFGPCIYIQLRHDSRVYVGETVNLSQRTMGHTGRGVEIDFIGAISTWMLTDEERFKMESFVIKEALLAGFPLANLDKVEEERSKTPAESQNPEKTDDLHDFFEDSDEEDFFPS